MSFLSLLFIWFGRGTDEGIKVIGIHCVLRNSSGREPLMSGCVMRWKFTNRDSRSMGG